MGFDCVSLAKGTELEIGYLTKFLKGDGDDRNPDTVRKFWENTNARFFVNTFEGYLNAIEGYIPLSTEEINTEITRLEKQKKRFNSLSSKIIDHMPCVDCIPIKLIRKGAKSVDSNASTEDLKKQLRKDGRTHCYYMLSSIPIGISSFLSENIPDIYGPYAGIAYLIASTGTYGVYLMGKDTEIEKILAERITDEIGDYNVAILPENDALPDSI